MVELLRVGTLPMGNKRQTMTAEMQNLKKPYL
jgi:hypothetical protein